MVYKLNCTDITISSPHKCYKKDSIEEEELCSVILETASNYYLIFVNENLAKAIINSKSNITIEANLINRESKLSHLESLDDNIEYLKKRFKRW